MEHEPLVTKKLQQESINVDFNFIHENNKRLESCERHDFGTLAINEIVMNKRFMCLNCHGQMVGADICNYVNGYVAAGESPNDIVRNWN